MRRCPAGAIPRRSLHPLHQRRRSLKRRKLRHRLLRPNRRASQHHASGSQDDFADDHQAVADDRR
jgi:hypothetical protein